MGKPSIFSSNYKQQVKKRRLNTFLFVLLVLCIGFFGGKYYLDKNNISLAKKIENNKIINSIRVPDLIGKIKGLFVGDRKSSEEKSPKPTATPMASSTAGTNGKPNNGLIPGNTSASTTGPAVVDKTVNGEYVYLAKNGYKYAVNYAKTANKVEITGLTEDTRLSEYSISSDKTMIVFDVKQDSIIVLCDAAGVFKILSRDIYKSTTTGRLYKRDTVLKTYENYIWAQKPYFTRDGRVMYISRIPYFKSSKMLYMWSVSLDGKIHKRVDKVGNDISKVTYHGFDDQNRLLVKVDGTVYYIDNGSYMLRKTK